ncbi:hypothetical protein ACOME3_001855 [Neoechinorhynchus agilis]
MEEKMQKEINIFQSLKKIDNTTDYLNGGNKIEYVTRQLKEKTIYCKSIISALRSLDEMELITYEDHQESTKEYLDLKNQVYRKQDQVRMLEENYHALYEKASKCIRIYNENLDFLNQTSGSITPRPQWERFGEVCALGNDRWENLINGKSSEEILDLIKQDIALESGNELIKSKLNFSNTIDGIPKHLRYFKKVQSYVLNKKTLCEIITNIWQTRIKNMTSKTREQPLSNYVYHHYEQKFVTDELIFEKTYSIDEACKKFMDDKYIFLFHEIINFRSIYFNKSELRRLLADCFKGKTEVEINELVVVAFANSSVNDEGNQVDYTSILPRSIYSHWTPFCDKLFVQFENERKTYCEQLLDHLQGMLDMTVNDLMNAFAALDPDLSENEFNRYVKWLFHHEKKKN